MRGSRGDYAVMCCVGVVAALSWPWLGSLVILVAGAVIAALAGAALIADLRRGRDWHRLDVLVRKLWVAVKRIPPGYVLTDPETGDLLSAERDRGWLTLAVADPPLRGREQVVTRYVVGHWGAPVRPPLARHQAGVDDVAPARQRMLHPAVLAESGEQASALEVTAAELAELIEQVTRTAVLGAVR